MSENRMSYEDLIAYASGELVEPDAGRIRAMLGVDPEASATVDRYRLARQTLLADDGVDPSAPAIAAAKAVFQPRPRPGLVDVVGGLIASLIFDSRAQPAVAGLRGQATSFQMTWELSATSDLAGQLDLAAEPEPEAPGAPQRWRVVGQLALADPTPTLNVDVCRAGSLSPTLTVSGDRRGGFMLHLEPGTWDFHLRLPNTTVVIPDIRIV